MRMKRCSLFFVSTLLFFLNSVLLNAQSFLTASQYFKEVSDYYATIKDYEADISIETGKNSLFGHVSYKQPEMLRIDFSNPAEQVILFNGDNLVIYLPGYSAILEQAVISSGNAATAQGLALLRRYYTIAYETGPDSVPFDEDDEENVVNLLLKRRSASESFTQIKLSVGSDSKLIRKVEARTAQGTSFTFVFSNYNLNSSISDQRFIYDPPSSANNYNNFLFSE